MIAVVYVFLCKTFVAQRFVFPLLTLVGLKAMLLESSESSVQH